MLTHISTNMPKELNMFEAKCSLFPLKTETEFPVLGCKRDKGKRFCIAQHFFTLLLPS